MDEDVQSAVKDKPARITNAQLVALLTVIDHQQHINFNNTLKRLREHLAGMESDEGTSALLVALHGQAVDATQELAYGKGYGVEEQNKGWAALRDDDEMDPYIREDLETFWMPSTRLQRIAFADHPDMPGMFL